MTGCLRKRAVAGAWACDCWCENPFSHLLGWAWSRIVVGAQPGGTIAGMARKSIIPVERIQRSILLIRGEKVMLDADLASLYGVETRALVQAVKRNLERFPKDFMFQLTEVEFDNLRSQSVISSQWGGRRTRPYAFTEQGVAMLSSVLRSKRAVMVNVQIMRTYVQLRRMLESHAALARKLAALEKKYDYQFKAVFDAIHQLMEPPKKKRRPVGFLTEAP